MIKNWHGSTTTQAAIWVRCGRNRLRRLHLEIGSNPLGYLFKKALIVASG
jgi:hypothetical protein